MSMRTLDQFHRRKENQFRHIVRRRALQIFACLYLCMLGARLCSAQREHPTEPQVKAAYLYNFGKFVRWQAPVAPIDSFDICVLGKNSVGPALATIVSGEKIEGKNIGVRNVSNVSEAAHCRILFISSAEEGHLKSILEAARQSRLLTVSDMPRFAQRGGMIGLVSAGGNIRFEVNVAAISESGLTVSSELLKVAVKVIGSSQAKEVGR